MTLLEECAGQGARGGGCQQVCTYHHASKAMGWSVGGEGGGGNSMLSEKSLMVYCVCAAYINS